MVKETNKVKKKNAIISFRTAEEIKRVVDREAKRRKQNRSDFVASVFLTGLELATGTPSK